MKLNSLMRNLPAIHELQKDTRFLHLSKKVSHKRLTELLKEDVSQIRKSILEGYLNVDELIPVKFDDYIFTRLEAVVDQIFTSEFRRVINGTGTVLHTNLGRARLSEHAIDQVIETASSYSNLEYNLELGKRGSRHDLIEDLIKETTGAEAAMVVNNNAAAVYLILKALTKDKEVIVSRGELIEIGGSFRISSIMEESGARLVEVGTTNKTHLNDYEQAITMETAMMMKVHTSNFKMIGFTKDVDASELVDIAAKNGILLYEDLGSGVLYDLKKHGIGQEPTVAEALQKGSDLVSFSGDKLLGGPQAGIIAGKKKWIDQLKKHQLARVLRVDKLTLAALEATLKEYLNVEIAKKQIPTLEAVLATKEEIHDKINLFKQELSPVWHTDVKQDVSQVGGGTMPEVMLATYVLHLSHKTMKAQEIHDQLRKGIPAIITRIISDRIALDFRTITTEEFIDIHKRLQEIDNREKESK